MNRVGLNWNENSEYAFQCVLSRHRKKPSRKGSILGKPQTLFSGNHHIQHKKVAWTKKRGEKYFLVWWMGSNKTSVCALLHDANRETSAIFNSHFGAARWSSEGSLSGRGGEGVPGEELEGAELAEDDVRGAQGEPLQRRVEAPGPVRDTALQREELW